MIAAILVYDPEIGTPLIRHDVHEISDVDDAFPVRGNPWIRRPFQLEDIRGLEKISWRGPRIGGQQNRGSDQCSSAYLSVTHWRAPAPEDQSGSGLTTTVSAIGTISVTGKSAAAACLQVYNKH